MSLDVLLEILRALEGLAAEVALVRLQRHVNTDVRGNVVTLDGCGAAVTPLARQIQVVGALAANVTLTNVVLLMVSTLCEMDAAGISEEQAYIRRRQCEGALERTQPQKKTRRKYEQGQDGTYI